MTSVWNGSCVALESPTVIFPFKAARNTSTNQIPDKTGRDIL
jgi:hypothetical protein